MFVNTKKNKYKNSKHFLLIYYPLKVVTWNCDNISQDNFQGFNIPIKSFDNLLQINRYINSKFFVKICYDAKIYCQCQLRVLIGIDTKLIDNSINKYTVNDKYNKDGYYFFTENMLFLEEFIEVDKLKELDKFIKLYNIKSVGESSLTI